MKPAQKAPRPLVAIPARWRGQEGYLHLSEEFHFVQFQGVVGTAEEVSLNRALPRLLDLAPRVPLLQEAAILCPVCKDWHPVVKDCGPAKARPRGLPERPLPAPPRRVVEIDAGPAAPAGSLQGADLGPPIERKPAPAADLPVRYKDEPSEPPPAPHLHLVPAPAERAPAAPTKNPDAVALGRRGGLKGGALRMAALSPEERTALGKKAAAARWQNPKPAGPSRKERRLARETRRDAALALIAEGKTAGEVAHEMGVAYATVRYWCKSAGVVPAKATQFIDITGELFGKLTALEPAHSSAHRGVYWRCRCECGQEIVTTSAMLRVGDKVSCGCHSVNKTHGASRTPEYTSWVCMAKAGPVCERWRHDFTAFIADVGKLPSPRHRH